jgi:hypothetical protein
VAGIRGFESTRVILGGVIKMDFKSVPKIPHHLSFKCLSDVDGSFERYF